MAEDQTTTTETGFGQAISDMKQNLASERAKVDSVVSTVVDAGQSALSAFKLVLAETGVWKQVIVNRGAVNTATPGEVDPNKFKHGSKDTSSVARMERDNPKKDYYLSLSDYLLPLSFDISIDGDKQLAQSQLVDGPAIIERIANLPRRIDIRFRLESKLPEDTTLLSSHVKGYADPMVPVSVVTKVAADLERMFRDIQQSDTVFEVSNPILNNYFNVYTVIVESYSVTPEQGSSLWDVTLSLLEVNTGKGLLYVQNSDGAQSGIPEQITTT